MTGEFPIALITQEIPRVGNSEIRTVDIDQICKKYILIIQIVSYIRVISLNMNTHFSIGF